MKKTCTNSTCRKCFEIFFDNRSVPRCPYCGKSYPNLRQKKKKISKWDNEYTGGDAEKILADMIRRNEAEKTDGIQAKECPYNGVRNEILKSLEKISIEELDLSFRSFSCLKRANINTLADIAMLTMKDLIRVWNLGRKSTEEIMLKLSEIGLSLAKGD